MNQTIIQVKTLRNKIQDLIEETKSIGSIMGNREKALAITKLQEAKMWAGMMLQELGNENPYPIGNDVTTDNINAPTEMGTKQVDGYETALVLL